MQSLTPQRTEATGPGSHSSQQVQCCPFFSPPARLAQRPRAVLLKLTSGSNKSPPSQPQKRRTFLHSTLARNKGCILSPHFLESRPLSTACPPKSTCHLGANLKTWASQISLCTLLGFSVTFLKDNLFLSGKPVITFFFLEEKITQL